MDKPEHAYLLDGRQLLFLLSLADSRPAVVFPLADPARVTKLQWEQLVMGLCQAGLLQLTPDGVAMRPDLDGLIRAMKDADNVYLACCRDAECKVQALYTGGAQNVLLQAGTGGFRLLPWPDTAGDWLQNALGLPRRVPDRPPAGPHTPEQLAPDLPDLRPGFGDPVTDWGPLQTARTILDRYHAGQPDCRLVWWQGALGCALLRQTPQGAELLPDSLALRRTIREHLDNGAVP